MSDIVERLREEGFITHMARLQRESKVLHGAADEIERLRAELVSKADELATAIGQRDGYLDGNKQTLRALAEANEIAARYKKERDDARRWLCEVLSSPDKVTGLAMPFNGTAQDFANENGWDCFKEWGGACGG